MHLQAAALVKSLRLEPHPEGGYFREVYRSGNTVHPADERSERAAVTSIYFLLAAGQHSRWHRVGSDEIWHFYEGEPLELHIGSPSLDRIERVTLSGFDGPGRLMHTVPAGCWQAAQPLGAYSLVGCTVAPGFEYEDFAFLRDDSRAVEALQNIKPDLMVLA
jgi:predicted cupin superfamily sugar epimerase